MSPPPTPTPIVATPVVAATPPPHRFWDRENTVLFAATGALAAADFAVTHSNLARGGRELNPITRQFTGSTAALATNFAVEASGSVAISYLFHRTGHHKLERLTSAASIGNSLFAVGYSASHR
jgi:hypothetical protein